MPQHLVDVCIPALDENNYFPETLSYLTEQSLYKKDMMQIIVCECIADGRESYLESILKQIKHTKFVRTPVANIGYQRNLAIAQGDSPIIVNFDADAHFEDPHAIEILIDPIISKEMVVTHCPHKFPDGSAAENNRLSKTVLDFKNELNRYLPIAWGVGLTFRRDAWQRVGGFPTHTKSLEDCLMTIKLSLEYSMMRKQQVNIYATVSDRRENQFYKNPLTAYDYSYHYR